MYEVLENYANRLKWLKDYPITISDIDSEEHPAWVYAGMVKKIRVEDSKIVIWLKRSEIGDDYKIEIHLGNEVMK